MNTIPTHPTREQLDALFASLNDRVCETKPGLNGLSQPERLYYSVSVLLGQVGNGGLEQFFSQSSASLLHDALVGLKALNATRTRNTLLTAARLVYPDFEESSETRTECPNSDIFCEVPDPLDDESTLDTLEKLDDQIYSDAEELNQKLGAYANDCGLLTPVMAGAN